MLTGSSFLAGVLDAIGQPEPCGVGHFVAAIQLEVFMERSKFEGRMDDFIEELKLAPLAENCDEILIAGEKEFLQWEKNIKRGVPVHEKVWTELRALCRQHHIMRMSVFGKIIIHKTAA